jgi:hypothetical protein
VGLVLSRFPSAGGLGAARDLFGLALFNLRTEFKKVSKPELAIITGCIRGLDHLLIAFTDVLDGNAADVAALYKYGGGVGASAPVGVGWAGG